MCARVAIATLAFLCTSSGYAATMELKATAVNGVLLSGGPASSISVARGDNITVEVLLSGWTPELLRAYQLKVEEGTLMSGDAGALSVSNGMIDSSRSDFPFFSVPASERFVLVSGGANPRFSSGLHDVGDSMADAGGAAYAGTMTIDVSVDALGTFVVEVDSAYSFLRNNTLPPGPIAMSTVPLSVFVGCPGGTESECCDINGNGARDDRCKWCECENQVCNEVPLSSYADVGAAFGGCSVDGFCNIHDRNHIQTCFAGTNTCSCFNMDVGGPFGQCAIDGFVNVHDANHAMACFNGSSTCLVPADPCSSGPTPDIPQTSEVVGAVRLLARHTELVDDTKEIRIDVALDKPIARLQSFELHVGTSGGDAGHLELVDIISLGDRYVLQDKDSFRAVNIAGAKCMAGRDDTRAESTATYLATFVYRPSKDASGDFAVEVLVDHVFGSKSSVVAAGFKEVRIIDAVPAVVRMGPVARRAER